MTDQKQDTTVYDKMSDAINHLSKMGQETDAKAKIWFKNFEEFTGFPPNKTLNALDVVKIMYKFYGEPK